MARKFTSGQYFGPADVNIRGDITVSAWVNPSTVASNGDIATNWGNFGTDQQFTLSVASAHYLFARTDGANYKIATGTSATAANVWKHIAGRANSTNGAEIWVGGVQEAVVSGALTAQALASNFAIAADYNINIGLTNPYAGLGAHVAIWNVSLSPSEIAALAHGASPLGIRPQSLLYYWPLNENNNGYALDLGPRRLHLKNSAAIADAADAPAMRWWPPNTIARPPWLMGIAGAPATFNPGWACGATRVIGGAFQ